MIVDSLTGSKSRVLNSVNVKVFRSAETFVPAMPLAVIQVTLSDGRLYVDWYPVIGIRIKTSSLYHKECYAIHSFELPSDKHAEDDGCEFAKVIDDYEPIVCPINCEISDAPCPMSEMRVENSIERLVPRGSVPPDADPAFRELIEELKESIKARAAMKTGGPTS